MRHNLFNEFKKELKSKCKKDDINENFTKVSQYLYDKYINDFKKNSAALIVENSGWGEHVLHHNTELETQLNDLILMEREREIE